MTARLILFVPRHPDVAAPWRLVSEAGQVLQRGRLEPSGRLPFDHPVTAIVAGTEVAVRWLDLPRARAAQLATAARWQMAEALGHDLGDEAVVLGTRASSDLVPVAAVARPLIEAWRTLLDGLDAPDVRLVPDHLCLMAEGDQAVIAPLPDGDVVLAGPGMNLTLSPELAMALLADRPAITLEASEVLDRLAVGSLTAPLDLIHPVAAPRGRSWRRALVLAALVLISPLILIWAEALRDNLKARSALNEARSQAVAFMPAAASDPDPLARVEQGLANSPPAGGQVRLLARLTTALEQVPGTRLAELDGTGRQLRGLMVLPSPDAVEPLRDALAGQGLSLDQCAVTQEEGRTLCAFDIKALS